MQQVTYECDRCGITSKDPAIDRWGSYSLTNFPKDVIHLCPSCEQAVEGNKVQRVEMVRRLLRRDYQRQPRDDWSRDGVAGTGERTELDWADVVVKMQQWLVASEAQAWEKGATSVYFGYLAARKQLQNLMKGPAAHDDGPTPNDSIEQDSTAAAPAASEEETDG